MEDNEDNDSNNSQPVQVKNVERLKEIIKEAIVKIRKARSRPVHQSILNIINEGDEFNLNMKSLKNVTSSMVERKFPTY